MKTQVWNCLFKVIRSKEILAEERFWEDNQDPKQLGEMIRIYLNEKKVGKNESPENCNKKFQGTKRP